MAAAPLPPPPPPPPAPTSQINSFKYHKNAAPARRFHEEDARLNETSAAERGASARWAEEPKAGGVLAGAGCRERERGAAESRE